MEETSTPYLHDRTVEQAQSEVASRLRSLVHARFDAHVAIDFLSEVTGGDLYLFGGALRRALFRDSLAGDVDIFVPNGDDRAFVALDALQVPFVLNSHGHRRYRWNYFEMDIQYPSEFFAGFDTVTEALAFADLKIDGLGMHWGAGRVLDPVGVISGTDIVDPGINWPHWEFASSQHVVVLAMRLVKICHEIPRLAISRNDGERIVNEVIPRIQGADWSVLRQRFPLGKSTFISMLHRTVLSRASTSNKPSIR